MTGRALRSDKQAIKSVRPSSVARGEPLIDAIADWLIGASLGESSLESLFEGCCNRLYAVGIPLARVFITFNTLHPLFEARSMTWRRDRPLESESFLHGSSASSPEWQGSPLFFMVRKGTPILRRRLSAGDAGREFPVLGTLAAEGCTDYLGTLVPFGPPGRDTVDGIVGSFATDRKSGFSDRDVAALLRIHRLLAVACRVSIERQVTRNILTAYLGRNAGRRVRSGMIRRGDGQTIAAAIWYSDLRDSTTLAETMPATEFLDLLNRYFECTAGAVLAGGGEVLTFIGDAVLAIFPIGPRIASAGQACAKAIAAADEAVRRVGALNAERQAAGKPAIHFGLGLHRGEIMFGNIGVPERLQFTAVGPAVNEVERIQTLSKTLGHPVLVSETFARTLRRKWTEMGIHRLRGVGKPVTVFAPAAVKAASAAAGTR